MNNEKENVDIDIAEQKLVQQAFHAADNLYKTLFNSIDLGFSLLEVLFDDHDVAYDIIIHDANEAQNRVDGVKAMVGKRVREIMPNIEDKWIERYGRIALTGQSEQFEDWSAANQRWYSVNALRLGNNDSRLVAIVYNDITEIKRSEQELLVNQEKYRTLFESIDEGYCLIQMLYDDKGKINDWRFLEVNQAFERHNGLYNAAGKTIKEMTPDIEDKWLEIYGRVAETGESIRFEEDSVALHRIFDLYAFRIGNPADRMVAVLFTNITERKNHESRQALLLKLSDALRPLADPAAIEEKVTQTAMDYFNTDRCYYCEIQDDNAIIRIDARKEDLSSVAGVYSLGNFVLFKAVVEAGRPFVVDDIYSEVNIDEELKEICIQLQKMSFIDIPVVKDGQAVGILCLVQNTPRKWTPMEIQLAEEIAERAWIAVNRASTERNLQKAEAEEKQRQMEEAQQHEIFRVSLHALEEERRRMAENLHNGLGQVLYGVKISLAGLSQHQTEIEFNKTKTYTNQLLTEAINESRRISHDLMPATLEEFGLSSAIHDICDQFQSKVQFSCTVKSSNNRLDKYLELAIYRTVQELMINVVKHSKAKRANVTVSINNETINIKVADNGIGLEASKNEKPGIGLASIRSKISLLNGKVKLNSNQKKGTTVEVTIPLL